MHRSRLCSKLLFLLILTISCDAAIVKNNTVDASKTTVTKNEEIRTAISSMHHLVYRHRVTTDNGQCAGKTEIEGDMATHTANPNCVSTTSTAVLLFDFTKNKAFRLETENENTRVKYENLNTIYDDFTRTEITLSSLNQVRMNALATQPAICHIKETTSSCHAMAAIPDILLIGDDDSQTYVGKMKCNNTDYFCDNKKTALDKLAKLILGIGIKRIAIGASTIETEIPLSTAQAESIRAIATGLAYCYEVPEANGPCVSDLPATRILFRNADDADHDAIRIDPYVVCSSESYLCDDKETLITELYHQLTND